MRTITIILLSIVVISAAIYANTFDESEATNQLELQQALLIQINKDQPNMMKRVAGTRAWINYEQNKSTENFCEVLYELKDDHDGGIYYYDVLVETDAYQKWYEAQNREAQLSADEY